MLEKLVGKDKLTIHQCQEMAKHFGFNGATFDLCGPKGKLPAKWLDAYFGLFQIDGQKGFVTVQHFQFADVWCENLQPKSDESSGDVQRNAAEEKE